MQHDARAPVFNQLSIKGILMVFGLFDRKKRRTNRKIVFALYEALTSAAREPALYEEMGVPDTVMGRFEMLAAHVILFLRRAGKGSESVAELGQEIVDEFFLDVDHSIRELGIGDMGVPKRVKKLGRMFYGRADSYGKALDTDDTATLATALGRNIHPGAAAGEAPDMRALAVHLTGVERALAALSDEELLQGRLSFRAAAPASSGAPA